VIALLFALLLVAMLLAWRNRKRPALVLFFVTIVIGTYWFKFHATTPLTIML
jgi:hypothetical protein